MDESREIETDSRRQQAQALLQQGQLEQAGLLFEALCHDNASDAELHYRLGSIKGRMGMYEDAVDSLRHAISLQPGAFVAYCSLGEALKKLGRYAESEESFHQALRLVPNSHEALLGLAFTLLNQHKLDNAKECLLRVITVKPDSADALSALGDLHDTQRQTEKAVSYFRQALKINPEHASANNKLGYALYRQGLINEAIAHQQRAIRSRPEFIRPYIDLGHMHLESGQLEAAKSSFSKALQINPEHIGAIAGKAAVYDHEGNFQAAYDAIRPLIERGIEHHALATRYARICRYFSRCDDAIALLHRILDKTEGNVAIQEQTHFNLANLYDEKGEYDKAFEHYQSGNATKPDTFNPVVQAAITSAKKEVFNWQYFTTAPRATVRSCRPVFIVGMPRSGTSLVEQILASHPDVYGAGELPDVGNHVANLPALLGAFPGYPHNMRKLTTAVVDSIASSYLQHLGELSPDALRVTDKMPQNFLHLGLIACAFPDARVIHCTRDPRDTCLSIYFQNFTDVHSYASKLEHLGFYYREYEKLMQHWKTLLDIPMLELHYEDLVGSQEEYSRKLLDFADLQWDERVLDFHAAGRIVSTASYDQVRQPMYSRSIGRWRHYEKHLKPLFEALGKS